MIESRWDSEWPAQLCLDAAAAGVKIIFEEES
jgi:hypothetical protein